MQRRRPALSGKGGEISLSLADEEVLVALNHWLRALFGTDDVILKTDNGKVVPALSVANAVRATCNGRFPELPAEILPHTRTGNTYRVDVRVERAVVDTNRRASGDMVSHMGSAGSHTKSGKQEQLSWHRTADSSMIKYYPRHPNGAYVQVRARLGALTVTHGGQFVGRRGIVAQCMRFFSYMYHFHSAMHAIAAFHRTMAVAARSVHFSRAEAMKAGQCRSDDL